MGTLNTIETNHETWLPSRLLIGRAPHCALVIADPRVSSEHASIRWRGGFWEIRDLGSRNGTFVDGQRVPPAEAVPLQLGAALGFGGPEAFATLADDSAPGLAAMELVTWQRVVGQAGMLGLPDLVEPELLVYAGIDGGWVVERDGELSPLPDDRIVEGRSARWRLLLPAAVPGTWEVDLDTPSLSTVTLEFRVSRDEEHVELTARHRAGHKTLDERAHHYLLLTLARERQTDAEQDPTAIADHGWVSTDRLARMLAVDTEHLRVLIHRARRQFARSGIDGAAAIVERRRGAVRLGTAALRIQRM